MAEEIKNYLIGIIIATMFIVGTVSLINAFRADNPEMIPSSKFQELNNSFNIQQNLTDEINDLQSSFQNIDSTKWGTFGVLYGLMDSAWQTFKFTLSNFNFITKSMTGFTTILGVPAWFVGLLTLIIIVIVVYEILGAIIQR